MITVKLKAKLSIVKTYNELSLFHSQTINLF